MIEVKIISQRGQSALVEYTEGGNLKRATIPTADIVDNKVSPHKLHLGISYGVEWAKYVTLQATPEQLQENLRWAGIWTKEDALNNADKVLGCIQATYQLDLGTLLRIAKEVK
jgi:hypothetical protein